jgi:hypothetical protein
MEKIRFALQNDALRALHSYFFHRASACISTLKYAGRTSSIITFAPLAQPKYFALLWLRQPRKAEARYQ